MTDNIGVRLGHRIAMERKRQHMSITDLSAMSGVGRNIIRNLETGVKGLPPGLGCPARRRPRHQPGRPVRAVREVRGPPGCGLDVQRLRGQRGGNAVSTIGCAISGRPPDLPDAGEGMCCMGAAVYGKDRCTCWVPVYDLDQQPLQPLQPGAMGLRDRMCPSCAYRPNSPEKRGEEGYDGDAEFLDGLVISGEFFACHQGIRRPVKWVHPSGAEVPGHPAGYDPPLRDGVPYKADGTPADLCAGWAAHRLKHMWREAGHD